MVGKKIDGTNRYELLKELINVLFSMSHEEQMELAKVSNIIEEEKEEDIDNQREHSREVVFIPTDITVDDKKVVNFIDDISEGGMFIKTPTLNFYVGQTITLDFTYKDVEHVNIKGEIVRMSNEGLGIKFIRG